MMKMVTHDSVSEDLGRREQPVLLETDAVLFRDLIGRYGICAYDGSPRRIVLSLLHTISLRAPSRNWASQPMLPTKKQALM